MTVILSILYLLKMYYFHPLCGKIITNKFAFNFYTYSM